MASFSGRHYTATEVAMEHEREFLKSAKAISDDINQQRRLARSQEFYNLSPAKSALAGTEQQVYFNDPAVYQASYDGPQQQHGSQLQQHQPPQEQHQIVISRPLSASKSQQMMLGRAHFISNPMDDARSNAPIRAWGCRRVRPVDIALPVNHQTRLPASGRVNKASLRTVASLPRSASAVDPVVRGPSKRSAGGHTFALPYHKQYNYYRNYSNAGQNALSAQHHNFPNGLVPQPTDIYSAGAMAACSSASARDHVHASEGYQLRYGTPSALIVYQRESVSQTTMTAVNYNPNPRPSTNIRSAFMLDSGKVRPHTAGPRSVSAGGMAGYTTSSSAIGSRFGI